MKICKLSNGWTGIGICINLETGEEVEMTKEVEEKLVDQMLSDYKVTKKK